MNGVTQTFKARDYKTVNRGGWTNLARTGCDSSKPFGPVEFRQARSWLDSNGWIPWREIRHVLCLASGGGQQAPLFASLGCRVVSADLSPEQLNRDRAAARRFGFAIECVEADMLDLSCLHGRDFDLVYQGVSACYVPDVRKLYREVASVVRPAGYYFVEHWNPVHLQLDEPSWNGRAYQVSLPGKPGQSIPWTSPDGEAICWHYWHSLSALIGGVCDAGFNLLRMSERQYGDLSAEPGSDAHLTAYLPAFFSLFAQRRT
jgi:SAM-dependent methyltransferase